MRKNSFLLAGKHPVMEAIKNKNRKIVRIYITENSFKQINKEYEPKNIFNKIAIVFKNNRELSNLCGSNDISHQGIIAEVEPLDQISIKEFLKNNKKENINFLALEDVTDARNIGSIIRTAAALKLDGIIIKDRLYPEKSKLMYKSASGGIEHINIFPVSNINTTLNYLKKENFWISAFDSHAKKDFITHDWRGRNILLFGSEGYGLRHHTLKNADFHFKIQISSNIESLNISNSVAIVLHHIQKIK
jgi:23S rRNA (guanosine2251-2'-O)-methyltransferase